MRHRLETVPSQITDSKFQLLAMYGLSLLQSAHCNSSSWSLRLEGWVVPFHEGPCAGTSSSPTICPPSAILFLGSNRHRAVPFGDDFHYCFLYELQKFLKLALLSYILVYLCAKKYSFKMFQNRFTLLWSFLLCWVSRK